MSSAVSFFLSESDYLAVFFSYTDFLCSLYHGCVCVCYHLDSPACAVREENVLSKWEGWAWKRSFLMSHTCWWSYSRLALEASKKHKNTCTLIKCGHTQTHAHQGWRAQLVLQEPGSPLVVHETSGAQNIWLPGSPGNTKSTARLLP